MSAAERAKRLRSRRARGKRCENAEVPESLTRIKIKERLVASGRVAVEDFTHPETLSTALGEILAEALLSLPVTRDATSGRKPA